VGFIVYKLPFKNSPISIRQLPVAMFFILLPVSAILVSVVILEDSVALLAVIEPISIIDLAIGVAGDPFSISFIISELAAIDTALAVCKDTLSVFEPMIKVAEILLSVSEDICPVAMVVVVSPFAKIAVAITEFVNACPAFHAVVCLTLVPAPIRHVTADDAWP
jgi:hypothetical protein